MGKPLYRQVMHETYVLLLYEYLDAQGHSPETVLGAPWPEPRHDAEGGIPLDQWGEMLERASRHMDDPLIGLHVGQTITSRHLGVLGTLLFACADFGSALQRLLRYQRVAFDATPMVSRIDGGSLDLSWDSRGYRATGLIDEIAASVIVHFSRHLSRAPVSPRAVLFAHAAHTDAAAFEANFGCPVLFEQPATAVRFGLDALALPLKSPDPALIAVLEQHAENLLSKLPQDDEFVDKVRRAITQLLREGEPDIAQVSARLCSSQRTMQRRLGDAGTTFRRELNLVRCELARNYLRDARLQVVDIALLLGYSEHSAFTRAYREWTGRTPQQERDAIQARA